MLSLGWERSSAARLVRYEDDRWPWRRRCFAAATEVVQSVLDFGRTGDKQDFIADCIGAGVAAALIAVLLVAVSRARMVRMVSIASLAALTLLVVAAIFGADLQTRAECFNVESQLLSDDDLSPMVRVRLVREAMRITGERKALTVV